VLARYPGPSQNFVYADVQGNIGYHAAGHLPIRKGCQGDLPVDGSKEECGWEGYIPYDELPQAFNPPSGMIVTANQNPFPADYKYPVNGKFAPRYRAQQIRARLLSQQKWDPAGILTVQKDVYSPFLDFFAHQIVAAWDMHPQPNPQLKDAIDELRRWNGQMEKGNAAPMVMALFYDNLKQSVAKQAAGMQTSDWDVSMQAPEVLEKLFRERPSGWFKDYDGQLLASLQVGIAEGEKLHGSRVSRWDYGQYMALTLRNPVFSQIPWIGRYLNIGPSPMSGSSTTVKQTSLRLGPSMRMVIDLANLDHSLANLTIGESGHLLSKHYKDQWSAYWSGQSFPMQFHNVNGGDVLRISPQ